jgi:hypothetical protein
VAPTLNRTEVDNITASPVDIRWHPGLPIYASEAFLASDGGRFGWLGGTDDQSELRCILPYSIISKPGLRMIRFRTQTIPLSGELSLEQERSFLTSAIDYFRSSGADMIIPSGNTAIFRTYPEGAAAAPYGTFIKDLSQPEEVLRSEIRKTYKQNIRKAVDAGVQIKCGLEYLDASYELIASTLKRSDSSFKGYEDFKKRVLAFGNYVKIFVAEHDGAIQGCMVAPFSDHTAYNCYAGSRPEPVLGAMHLLHWEAILQFRAAGVRYFDFQGVRINPEKSSKQYGILNYKQGFGGRLVEGYLWRYPLRPLKGIVYSMAVRLVMGGDIVDQERSKLARK